MVYILFLFVTMVFLMQYEKSAQDNKAYLLFLFPVIVFWVLLIGGQYNVGTDYTNYINLFTEGYDLDWVFRNYEYVFGYFIELCWLVGVDGQGILFVIAFIESLIFFHLMKDMLHGRDLYIALFLFVCFSTAFNNQMNGIRQYLAMYVVTYSAYSLLKGKVALYLITILIAMGIHKAALFFFIAFTILYLFRGVRRENILYGSIAVGAVLGGVQMLDTFNKYLPFMLDYSRYTDTYLKEIDSAGKLLRYLFIPLYFYSIKLLPSYRLDRVQLNLFTIGVFSYAIRLSALNLTLTNRFGMFFEILMIFPLIFLLAHLKKKSVELFGSIIVAIFFIYLIKVTFLARGEYAYQSYFFS